MLQRRIAPGGDMSYETRGCQISWKLLSTTCLTLLAVSPAFAQGQTAAMDATQQVAGQESSDRKSVV